MKRLIKTVDLVFFCDDANGDYGLAHKETINESNGFIGFNAFWGGMGIFHDVFEHSHEFTNKYFMGEAAMNIGGEMAAMGSMLYYIDEIGIGNRLRNNFRGNGETMKEGTISDVMEAIRGYCNYGNTLVSNVPKQKVSDNLELEYQISEYYKNIKNYQISDDEDDEDVKEFGTNYKNSVTFRKIADLHRYGYKMAEKLVPHSWENTAMLYEFIEFWNELTKNNTGSEMANLFKGLTIKLYKDENGNVTWKGCFKSKDTYSIKDIKVNNETKKFFLQDHCIIED